MKPVYRLILFNLMIIFIIAMILVYVVYKNKYIFLLLIPIYIIGKILFFDIGFFSTMKKISMEKKKNEDDKNLK